MRCWWKWTCSGLNEPAKWASAFHFCTRIYLIQRYFLLFERLKDVQRLRKP